MSGNLQVQKFYILSNNEFLALFPRYSVRYALVSDDETQFTGKEFQEFFIVVRYIAYYEPTISPEV